MVSLLHILEVYFRPVYRGLHVSVLLFMCLYCMLSFSILVLDVIKNCLCRFQCSNAGHFHEMFWDLRRFPLIQNIIS